MDYTLSSTGLQNVDANEFRADNATVITSLSVSGVNILSSINNLNSNVNNLNSYIGTSNSSLSITGTTQINFNAGGMNLTNINSTGLNVYHTAMTDFPFNYSGYYNVRERFDNLRHVFLDAADPMIKYDGDHNTIIKINEADYFSPTNPSLNYPKRIIFKDFLNNVLGYINSSGLSLLDMNGNYNNISTKFTQTGNSSLLLCSNKMMVDSAGALNVYQYTTNTILGFVTGTSGSWLNVADTLNANISNLSTLKSNYSDVLSQLTTISGNAANIANIANYYSGLQSSLAVVNGSVSTTGLVLAFDLKENRFNTNYPLIKTSPSNGTSFNTLSLNYNNTLSVDQNNKLSVNSVGFLTPSYGDLGLRADATGNSYVVLKNISQPMTCMSSLNVSGNTTINGALNVTGHIVSPTINNLSCDIINSLNASFSSILLTTSSTSFNIPNTSYTGLSMISGTTTLFNNNININGRTTFGQTSDIYNYSDSVIEAYKNLSIRKVPITVTGNTVLHDRIDLQVGLGLNRSYISLEEGGDINISATPSNSTSLSLINIASNNCVYLATPKVICDNDLRVTGKITCLNLGQRLPICFTTSRNVLINGITFSVYDLDLTKYTNFVSLDGHNVRQFRVRHWSDFDFEGGPSIYDYPSKTYNIFMSDVSGLKIYSLSSPLENEFLWDTSSNQFLYRNTFDSMMYCSRQGVKKVYMIIEDLL